MTVLDQRLSEIKGAVNPLLEASRILLRAQADMPAKLSQDAALALRNLLMQEVRSFDLLCMQANIRTDHALGAKYCLCTALDEAAMKSAENNAVSSTWAMQSLATAFLEDSKGGDKVFLLIARLLTDPVEHRDLLDVIYRILSLGFEGRFRREADGARKHDSVRQHVYEAVTTGRAPPLRLAPHWRFDSKRKRSSFFNFPVWMNAVLLGLVLLGFFTWFRYQLSLRSDEVLAQLAAIGQLVPAPSAPSTVLRLKQLLSNEIAAGVLSVDEDAYHSAVTFRGDAMFASGEFMVKGEMKPLIVKIANEIIKVPGNVTVLGYTDNVPVRISQAGSNQVLSEQRAFQVLRLLQEAGVPSSRIQAIGKGEADPIGDNATAEGRARNRRVEILVTQ
jgi:type VI secretion system protein ImpK